MRRLLAFVHHHFVLTVVSVLALILVAVLLTH